MLGLFHPTKPKRAINPHILPLHWRNNTKRRFSAGFRRAKFCCSPAGQFPPLVNTKMHKIWRHLPPQFHSSSLLFITACRVCQFLFGGERLERLMKWLVGWSRKRIFPLGKKFAINFQFFYGRIKMKNKIFYKINIQKYNYIFMNKI